MNLDMFFLDNFSLDKVLRDVLALITLELDYLPQLFVLDHIAVATKLLLETLEDLVQVQVLVTPLNRGQALLPIPLLDPDVDAVLASAAEGDGVAYFGVRKWVERARDLVVLINHVSRLLFDWRA